MGEPLNADVLIGLGSGEHRIPCPECARKPSDKTLGVTVDNDRVVWHCFRCGIRGAAGTGAQRRDDFRPTRRTVQRAAPLEWSTVAHRIWSRTQELRGTLGETYLNHRGCVLPPRDSHLRYLPPDGKHPPSLCAAITAAATGKALSLHFTRLAADGRGKAGTDLDKLMLKGHRKAGGVIRLWPDDAVTTGLAIAEGIETALASAHVFTPIWAAIDAGNLGALPVLDGIDALTIFADHDDAGIAAASTCASRWASAGCEVYIVRPRAAGKDIADLLAAA